MLVLTPSKPKPGVPFSVQVRAIRAGVIGTYCEALAGSTTAADGASVDVAIRPGSDRLEALAPFPAWDGRDVTGLRVLMKATGKCTTDHISPAGPWLKYRGHLTNISGNLFIGANNAFALEPSGTGVDVRDGSHVPLPELADFQPLPGEKIVRVGEPADAMYFIAAGSVTVLTAFGPVKLKEGDFFGEIAALSRSPRTATIFAVGDKTELLEIRWQGLRDLLRFDDRLRQHIDRIYRERTLATHLRAIPMAPVGFQRRRSRI